ncbi:MAG: 5-formyltetrahydrofolate cyclo-ligase [Pseudomonadota bacterium]
MTDDSELKTGPFDSKDAARQAVWDTLANQGLARFPYPPHGRIPNFAGARQAAERLLMLPIWDEVSCIKANPDAPQRDVRRLALERGITVVMPTPRLRDGFMKLAPDAIAPNEIRFAASLNRVKHYATHVQFAELPTIDLVVTGSVAITDAGKRLGKGHGYGDLEYAMICEIQGSAPIVVTTVHDAQMVLDFPTEAHDLWVDVIVTPHTTVDRSNARSTTQLARIDWERLSPQDLEAMPVLTDFRAFLKSRSHCP